VKKRPDPGQFNEFFYGVVLYRDDIQLVVDRLKEVAKHVEISDTNYSFDSLDDLLDQHGVRPRSFSITGYNEPGSIHDITISFERGFTYLDCWRRDSLGAVPYELKELLRSRLPWYSKLLQPVYWFLAILAILAAGLVDPFPLLAAIVFGGSSFFALWYRYLVVGVTLRKRHEGGFLKRNADRLALLAVGALLGAVVTLLLKRLIG